MRSAPLPTRLVAAAEAMKPTRLSGSAGQPGWAGRQADHIAPTASSRLKLIDSFMLFLMLTGVAQFLYCVLVTNFPFNAFIGGCVPSSFSHVPAKF